MDEKVIGLVGARGREAAELLLSHFDHSDPGMRLTGDNHRCIRMRSFLARVEEMLLQFHTAFTKLLNREKSDPHPVTGLPANSEPLHRN